LAGGRVLPRLQTLTLPSIDLSVGGAEILRDHASTLGHLGRLDLRGNKLAARARGLVSGLCAEVLLDP